MTASTPVTPRSWRASGRRTDAVDGHPELAVEDHPQVQRASNLVAAAHPARQRQGLAASDAAASQVLHTRHGLCRTLAAAPRSKHQRRMTRGPGQARYQWLGSHAGLLCNVAMNSSWEYGGQLNAMHGATTASEQAATQHHVSGQRNNKLSIGSAALRHAKRRLARG